VLEHALYACQRAVFDKRWFFIRTYHEGFYDFDPVVLYDLHNDPNQLVNVADKNPEIVHLMDHRLTDWIQLNLNKHGKIIDPMQEVIRTGPFHYIKPGQWAVKLREMGWNQEAKKLEEKYK
jgi:choline-sulfatase